MYYLEQIYFLEINIEFNWTTEYLEEKLEFNFFLTYFLVSMSSESRNEWFTPQIFYVVSFRQYGLCVRICSSFFKGNCGMTFGCAKSTHNESNFIFSLESL